MHSALLTVLVALIAAGIWVGVGFLIPAVLQVRRAAKAVEILAYRAEDSLSNLHGASLKFGEFADKVRSGWMRALELILGAAATVWQRRGADREREADSRAQGSGGHDGGHHRR